MNASVSTVTKSDIAVAAVIAASAFALTLTLALQVPPRLAQTINAYYGSDLGRVFNNMVYLNSHHFRTKVHPLFSFLVMPPVRYLTMVLGDPRLAVAALMAALGGVTQATLYVTVRLLGGTRLAAGLTCGVALASGGYLFWWTVPEAYAFGGTSIAVAWLALVVPRLGFWKTVAVSAATLSFTITNWVAGLLVGLARWPLRRAIAIGLTALAVVAILALWQKTFIPTAGVFFHRSAMGQETNYILWPTETAVLLVYLRRVAEFVVFCGVSGQPATIQVDGVPQVASAWLPVTIPWAAAAGCWLFLLARGAVALTRRNEPRRLMMPLAGFLAFQAALHAVYGDEPFLYAAHSLPAFAVLVGLGLAEKGAWTTRVVALAYVALAFLVNSGHFLAAVTKAATL